MTEQTSTTQHQDWFCLLSGVEADHVGGGHAGAIPPEPIVPIVPKPIVPKPILPIPPYQPLDPR